MEIPALIQFVPLMMLQYVDLIIVGAALPSGLLGTLKSNALVNTHLRVVILITILTPNDDK